jgi:hypothetical protein
MTTSSNKEYADIHYINGIMTVMHEQQASNINSNFLKVEYQIANFQQHATES